MSVSSLLQVRVYFRLCALQRRSTFSKLVLVITVISSVSSFVKPTANAYALNCFGLHLLYTLITEMKW